VANAVLDVMLADGFLPHVEKMAALLARQLDGLVRKYPRVLAERRGKGLLTGLKCVVPSGEMVEKLRQAGLLTVGAGENVVRLLPPLIVDDDHIEEAVGIIGGVARQWPH
jgi:acetylornithine/N-succinyldiaminopimelate aminotransferase